MRSCLLQYFSGLKSSNFVLMAINVSTILITNIMRHLIGIFEVMVFGEFDFLAILELQEVAMISYFYYEIT